MSPSSAKAVPASVCIHDFILSTHRLFCGYENLDFRSPKSVATA